MKPTIAFARLAVLTLLALLSLAATGAAADYSLNYPYGLAVAPNGNLYVANSNANQILVYSPAHTLLKSKTITAGISAPSGLAFDYAGNLWVANAATSNVIEYTGGGVNPGNPIPVTNPQAIAFDGVNDLWINSGFSEISVYVAYFNTLLFTYTPSANVTGLSFGPEGIGLFGTNTNASLVFVSPFLASQGNAGPMAALNGYTCFASAFDAAGNIYCANENDSLVVFTITGSVQTLVSDLGFFPTGLALDKTRGFVYVSGGTANEIAVYNTSGKLLTVIANP